jgi:hypothetical protein
MSLSPTSFDHVEVMQVGVAGPTDANQLFIVTGVALIGFQGPNKGFNRGNVSFLVPQEGEGNPLPLDIGQHYRDSIAIAFPATVVSDVTAPVGWGVDSVDAVLDGSSNVRLTAKLAVLNPGGNLIRMGFQVHILAHL